MGGIINYLNKPKREKSTVELYTMKHKEREETIANFWEKNKIFEKSVEQRSKNKQYIFYDGPPFATGTPHYGHILGLTSKDVFPRFWTMKGFRVERRWGWDCHGLPIENIAEKELGIKEKKQIEEMGIDKFNEFCRSKVLAFAKEWKKTIRRMGKWIEFDNSYKTMDNSYMETVWYIFKRLYDEKYVYEGKKILLYCPRCETPLAASEIAMDNSYRKVTEKTVIAKFKLKEEKDTYVLAWTTTAWTLIGNVALAINPMLTYVKIKQDKEQYILAKDRLMEVKGKYDLLEEIKGSKLVKKEYEPLYHIPSEKKGHYILDGGNEVTATDGTGIVHMAVYGEFDYTMIKKYDLPIIQHVNYQGKLHLGPQEWFGLWFKKADEKVMEDLKKRNLLYKAESYTHEYPFCYRCETPLFYNAVDSWFVDIQKVKDKLLKKNKDINWHPEHIKEGRFKHILESAPDWSISRNRFWATAIPVWKCKKCNLITVMGSVKDLQEKAVEKIPKDLDLHKHIVDKIHVRCEKCKGSMNRIPEVMDCWFESGSMPYAAKHYPFENKEWFKDNFPCDFVSEYVPQVRAWFYYMHVLGVILFEKAPFKHIVVTGTVLALDGTKMAKSKGNFPDPQVIFDKYGADALRFYLMSSPLMKAEDINFNEETIKDFYRKIIMITENVKQFYELYGKENARVNDASSDHILDRWMISRVHTTIKEITAAMEVYDTVMTCSQIVQLIDDISTWYVRRSRDRFKFDDVKEKQKAIRTLAYTLHTLAKLMAPIAPFIAEEVQQTLRKTSKQLAESVHLEAWPEADTKLVNKKLNEEMQMVRNIVSKALEAREKAKVPVRQILKSLEVTGPALAKEYISLITEEVNVKEVIMKKSGQLAVKLDTRITPELLKEGMIRDIIRTINSYRKSLGLQIDDRIALVIGINEDMKEFTKEIQQKVGAKNVVWKKKEDVLKGYDLVKKEQIKDKEIEIAIKKL